MDIDARASWALVGKVKITFWGPFQKSKAHGTWQPVGRVANVLAHIEFVLRDPL